MIRFNFLKMSRPKILVLGYARHGKDTVCEILRDNYGFSFASSSEICCQEVIFPILKDKYGYTSPEECFKDRVNHRSEWYDLIREFNKKDPAKLGKIIFSKYDIYCGLRSKIEFEALKEQKIFDFSVWIDSSERGIPVEDSSSMTIDNSMAEIRIRNNGSIDSLKKKIDSLMEKI